MCDYSPIDWSLAYIIRNKQGMYHFPAVADGGVFKVTLASNTTAAWKAGVYAIGAYVTSNSAQQVEVRTAFPTFTVLENLAGKPQGIDPRSFAEKTLDGLELTIAKLTTRTVDSASVNGQAYTLANISELWKMRERLKSEIRREKAQERLNAGRGASNKIGVRFRPMQQGGWPYYNRPPWQ